MISAAIIGAGRIGKTRAAAIRRSNTARLAAVVDTDRARAEALVDGNHAVVSRDWQSVVTLPEVDAVVICTPTKFHLEIAVAALRAGKHVLCEKPLGRNVREARTIFDVARDSRGVFKTGFNYRHMSHVRKAKELLDAGVLGSVNFLRSRYGHGGRPGYETEWCTDADLSGGGVLLEQGIHIFDLIRVLLGEPTQVVAQTERYFWKFPAVEDNGFCLLKTDRGQLAQIHISWTQWVNIFEIELFGRDGYLRLEGRDSHYGTQRLTWGKRRPDHGRPEEQIFDFLPIDSSWDLEWHEFCSAIAQARDPVGNVDDGLRAQELIGAAYESVSRHSWISIPVFQPQGQGATR